jgi:hypothetical protein
MISSRSVKIQWQQQLTDLAEVTKFLVQYQESHGECSEWSANGVLAYIISGPIATGAWDYALANPGYMLSKVTSTRKSNT